MRGDPRPGQHLLEGGAHPREVGKRSTPSPTQVATGVNISLSYLSPVDVLILFKDVTKEKDIAPPEIDERLMLDDEEEQIMDKLTTVPTSFCSRFRHKICKYRKK